MESIKVFAPASVANVGCGYDIFGFALNEIGDLITLTKRNDSQLVISEVIGTDLPLEPEKNVATVALKSLLTHLNSDQGFDITIHKKIPPCSGLGSSACSASGSVFAASQLLDTGLTKSELIPFAMEGEMVASKKVHADNIAPSMLGGFTVVRSVEPEVDVFQIDYPEGLNVLIIFPQVEVKTAEATQMLGDTVKIMTARKQWGNVAGLTTGMITSNWDLIQKSMDDFVAEPVRKSLIPHYDEVKRIALESGAYGFNISGSGPSMFAFYKDENASDATINVIRKLYDEAQIDVLFFRSEINEAGTKIMD